MSGKLFIISAPSGAGKTTVVSEVLKKVQSSCNLERVVTYTSRKPREGELQGKDYNFLSSQEFEKKISENFFLEWSGEYGNYYGTPRFIADNVARGSSYLLIIDMVGAHNIVSIANDPTPLLEKSVVPVWVYTKTMKDLESRLVFRGKNSHEQIQRRLKQAQKEIEAEKRSSLYVYRVLNDDLSRAVEELASIVKREIGVISL